MCVCPKKGFGGTMRYRIFHQIQSAIFSELKMLNVNNMSSQTRKIRDWYQTDRRIVATKITDSSNINSRFRQQNREFHLEIEANKTLAFDKQECSRRTYPKQNIGIFSNKNEEPSQQEPGTTGSQNSSVDSTLPPMF